jgi:hypothetical protein
LHIDTAFRRVSVPGALLGGFERDGTQVRLVLTSGERLSFHVDTPIRDVTGGGERPTSTAGSVRSDGSSPRSARCPREGPPRSRSAPRRRHDALVVVATLLA